MKYFVKLVVLLGVVLSSIPVTAATLTDGESFVFTAAGDHGYSAQTNRSIDVVANSGSRFYLALGDLSYAPGAEQSWCADFKKRFNDVAIIVGNHDAGESSGGNIDKYIAQCPFTLGSLNGSYGKQYYFDYPGTAPLARLIMIAPGVRGSVNIDYTSGGAGYNWTRDAISGARAAGIKWIVVGMHKTCISIGDKWCEVGTDIMNLLIDSKVDLILQGHDHNYQRSHQLKCITPIAVDAACIVDDGSDGIYPKGGGPVIVINGAFGRSLYGLNKGVLQGSYFARANSTAYGVTKFTVTKTQIMGQYLRAGGASFADSFTIKESAPRMGIPPHGLTATYYNNADFTGTSITRVDPLIDFSWIGRAPDPAVANDTFSVRWTGYVVPRYSEKYTFYAWANAGMKVWVNNQLIIDQLSDRRGALRTGTIRLDKDQRYPIKVEFQGTQLPFARLSWSSASQAREVIPAGQLWSRRH